LEARGIAFKMPARTVAILGTASEDEAKMVSKMVSDTFFDSASRDERRSAKKVSDTIFDTAFRDAFLESAVRAVRFADGDEIPADLVVMAVGIAPNVDLARRSGLACDRGVLVDDTMQT